jgi:serine protease Do
MSGLVLNLQFTFTTMMFTRYFIPLFLTATTVLMDFNRVDAARQTRAILAREVGRIAKRTVVRIESSTGEFGSGTIVGRKERGKNNIYTILTVAHVVKNLNSSYRIIAPIPLDSATERKRVAINLIDPKRNIKIIPNIDLAIVSFESKHTFAIGTLGNSEYADEGSPVYVAGFPKPGRAIKRIALQFTGGMVSSRLDDSVNGAEDRNDGYDLAYTNITRAGMSGGPVLDAAGRIVGVHGRGDRNDLSPSSEMSNREIPSEKTGFNLGIPMQNFLKIQPKISTSVGARIDQSPINYQLADRSFTIGTKSKKFNQKFRTRSDSPPLFDVTKINEISED